MIGYDVGGNALKNTKTRRYELSEYLRIENIVNIKLTSIQGMHRAYTLPHIRDKIDFGDLDVLYTTDADIALDVSSIQSMFNPNEIKQNGEVISFNVEELQVDAIHSLKAESEYALCYFSYNDIGNLLGKIFRKFGLKHGHRGLRLPIRDVNDHIIDEVLITLDHDKALKFIGLCPDRFKQGFDSLQDMFDYVASCRYYNPDFYKLENLNTIAKTRDRKRSTYNKFLAYGLNWNGIPYEGFNPDKSVYIDDIFKNFPDALDGFRKAMKRIAVKRYISTKFNGDIVRTETRLVGKELGMFMRHIKPTFNFSDEMIVYLSEDQIRENIHRVFNETKTDVKEEHANKQ